MKWVFETVTKRGIDMKSGDLVVPGHFRLLPHSRNHIVTDGYDETIWFQTDSLRGSVGFEPFGLYLVVDEKSENIDSPIHVVDYFKFYAPSE